MSIPTYITIAVSTIAVIIGILQIFLIVKPKETKKFLKKWEKKSKSLYDYLSNLKKDINFSSVIIGILLIIFVLSGTTISEKLAAGDIDQTVIGVIPTCNKDICYYQITGGNDAYFRLKWNHDSLVSLKIRYVSEYDQKIEVGFGNGEVGYNSLNKDLKQTTDSSFHEADLISNEDSSVLCETCFEGIFRNILDTFFGSHILVKITPEKDLKISSIISTSNGNYDTHRIMLLIVGLIYVIAGFVGFRKRRP